MAKTEQHLKEAFAGESQANRKYLAYAKKAERKDTSRRQSFFGRRRRRKPSMPTTICRSSAWSNPRKRTCWTRSTASPTSSRICIRR